MIDTKNLNKTYSGVDTAQWSERFFDDVLVVIIARHRTIVITFVLVVTKIL